MITVNNQTFENFNAWCNACGEDALKAHSFSFENVKELTDPLRNTKRKDVVSGAFSQYGIIFRISEIFNVKDNAGRLRKWQFAQAEGGPILRIESTSDYQDFIVARCNDKGIIIPENDLPDKHRANNNKCGKSRKQSFKTATPDNIGQIKAQLDALLETLQPLTEVADIAQDIARIRCAIRSVWAQQLSAQRAEARKVDALKKLSGLTPDQIEKLMQLL